METSGFYKYQDVLLFAPNCVLSAEYELYRESRNEYTYPVDGWYWFDSEQDAKIAFNIQNSDPTNPV